MMLFVFCPHHDRYKATRLQGAHKGMYLYWFAHAGMISLVCNWLTLSGVSPLNSLLQYIAPA